MYIYYALILKGVGLDGFLIFGPIVKIGGVVHDFTESNTANGITLDECHGTEIDAVSGDYAYVANHVFPYIMGCFRGEPSLTFPFTDQTYECLSKCVSFILLIVNETNTVVVIVI